MSNAVPRTSKMRAPMACLSCRTRKVRCDVAQRGPPCMKRSLDDKDCVVKERLKKYNISKHDTNRRKNAILAVSPFHQFSSIAHISNPSEACKGVGNDADGHLSRLPDIQDKPTQVEPSESTCELHYLTSQARPNDMEESEGSDREGARSQNLESYSGENTPYAVFDEGKHVKYSHYSFLEIDSISRMHPRDVDLLEQEGCFHVPNRSILDELIREYFLHVNPILPILNEGDFWEAYAHQGSLPSQWPHLSLFVFQAMLFVSCSYFSPKILNELGFKNARSARAVYYRRAKALFDLDENRNSISTAQGALLLSYHSPTRDLKINTFWLSTAIYFAKDANAHQYHWSKNICPKQKNVLKRLWWCCILRDRILPLGVRRPLQISSNDFDFDLAPLSEIDFNDEIRKSRVYDAAVKRLLIQLFAALCELAVVLTEVIMVVYPMNDYPPSDRATELWIQNSLISIDECHRSLDRWYERTTVQFPTPAVRNDTHESLVLYTNLIYIYYHSAKSALSHRLMLMLATQPRLEASIWDQKFERKRQLEEASGGITKHLKELIHLKLAKYLPISVVAYTALPLVLHVLDVKLSSTVAQISTKQRHLSIYTEAMREFRSQYDGADHVSDLVEKMVEQTELKSLIEQSHVETYGLTNRALTPQRGSKAAGSPTNPSSNLIIRDWGDFLLHQPNRYLRLSLTIDFSLSKGRYPTDKDFPLSLQHVNSIEHHFPMYPIILEDDSRRNTDDQRSDDETPQLESRSTSAQIKFNEDIDGFDNMFLENSDDFGLNSPMLIQDLDTSFELEFGLFMDVTQLDNVVSEF